MWPVSKKSFIENRQRLGFKRDQDDADYYGVCKTTVGKFRRENDIPAIPRTGGPDRSWCISEAEFRALHEKYRTDPAVAAAAGVNRSSVRWQRMKYNIKPYFHVRRYEYDDMFALVERLESFGKVAQYLGVSRDTVRSSCRSLGIKSKIKQNPPRRPFKVKGPKLLTDRERRETYGSKVYEDSPIAARPEGRWRGP